jgi:hypothetical protein
MSKALPIVSPVMRITTGTVMIVMIGTVTIVHARTRVITLVVLIAVVRVVLIVAYMITHASLALYSRVMTSMVYI